MVKQTFIKLICVITAMCMLAALFAGCSGTNKQDDQSKQSSTETTTGKATQTEPPKKNINLVIWNPTSWQVNSGDKKKEDMTAYKFIKKFEQENPHITVELVTHPAEQYGELLKSANAAKNGPDMLLLWPGNQVNNNADFLVPLDKYLKEDMKKRYMGWKECRKGLQDNGEILGIPATQYLYLMYYNKEMYKKVGVDETNLPKSWQELMDVFAKLKQQNILPMYVGDKEGIGTSWGIGCIVASLVGNGVDEFTKRTKKMPGSVYEQAFDLWAQLGKKGYINKDFSSVSVWDVASKFANGAAATMLDGSWDLANVYNIMKDNMGLFIVPCGDPSNPNKDYTWAGPGLCYSVTNYSANIDDAVKLAIFVASEDFQVSYANEVGELPSIIDIDETKLQNPSTRNLYKVAKQVKAVNTVRPKAPGANQELDKIATLLLTGKITAKELAERYDKLLEKELEGK